MVETNVLGEFTIITSGDAEGFGFRIEPFAEYPDEFESENVYTSNGQAHDSALVALKDNLLQRIESDRELVRVIDDELNGVF